MIAWTAWETVLTDGGLSELRALAVWVDIYVDVGDTHGDDVVFVDTLGDPVVIDWC